MKLNLKYRNQKVLLYVYDQVLNALFLDICTLSPAPVGLFSRPRLRGTQGSRVYTTV